MNGTCCFLVALALAAGRAASVPCQGSEHSFDSNGVKIHYIVEGSGEPVILIHGLYSSAFVNWQMPGVVALLAKDHRVLALDVRGHGASDKPTQDDAYGVEMVEDVLRLMDREKIQKAHLIGYSMGGMITMKFMVLHPERVSSGLLGGMGWLREGGMLGKMWGFMLGGLLGTPAACPHSFGKLAVSEAELKAVKVPVEVLVGDRDPCRTLYVAPLRQVREDWPVIEIAGAGHMDCIVKPQFKDEVQKWIAKQSGK
jgi:pimeloyl-ACP methyl ester carboxylesterase